MSLIFGLSVSPLGTQVAHLFNNMPAQLEDGYTRIANEILEKLSNTYLSPYEWQVLMFIFRKTYGFGKKADWIANSQLVEATGIHKSHISRTLKKLKERHRSSY